MECVWKHDHEGHCLAAARGDSKWSFLWEVRDVEISYLNGANDRRWTDYHWDCWLCWVYEVWSRVL